MLWLWINLAIRLLPVPVSARPKSTVVLVLATDCTFSRASRIKGELVPHETPQIVPPKPVPEMIQLRFHLLEIHQAGHYILNLLGVHDGVCQVVVRPGLHRGHRLPDLFLGGQNHKRRAGEVVAKRPQRLGVALFVLRVFLVLQKRDVYENEFIAPAGAIYPRRPVGCSPGQCDIPPPKAWPVAISASSLFVPTRTAFMRS